MKAQVSKWELKKYAEQYPNFYDCPDFVPVEVIPVLSPQSAKRLYEAVLKQAKRKKTKK